MECLICGKDFKNLRSHLPKHRISSEQYKKRFNLPREMGIYEPPKRGQYQKWGYGYNPEISRAKHIKSDGVMIGDYIRDRIISDRKKSVYLSKRKGG